MRLFKKRSKLQQAERYKAQKESQVDDERGGHVAGHVRLGRCIRRDEQQDSAVHKKRQGDEAR